MRMIDADALINSTDKEFVHKWEIALAPTIEAEPIKHGKWIKNDNGTYSCSECHSWIPNEQHYYAKYCLYCGAIMDEVEK